jgi:hypothetical protein
VSFRLDLPVSACNVKKMRFACCHVLFPPVSQPAGAYIITALHSSGMYASGRSPLPRESAQGRRAVTGLGGLSCRGRLVPGHCLIVPSDHVASARQVDEHVWTEIRNFKKCLLQMFMAQVGGLSVLSSYWGGGLWAVLSWWRPVGCPFMGAFWVAL